MPGNESSRQPGRTAFNLYLRTGRRPALAPPVQVEVKFNPWHDEEDGRFTFAGQGRYFPRGGNTRPQTMETAAGGQVRRPARPDSDGVPDRRHLRADHPGNHSTHIVQPGDTLTRIAARRKGLSARDLAWLNQHPLDRPLSIGQRIKLPHQAYLDAGQAARAKFLALAHYMDTHGGKLPPDPANPPSLESQILDTNWRKETKNGYDFHMDVIARPREVVAVLTDGPIAQRSRRAQAQAGQPDRRPGDDGGHFIAARFNGPGDSVNHFAQDRNFNRGAYRAMEDGWARNLRDGKSVVVHIVPLYAGTSKRPYRINVTWRVNGKEEFRDFSNESKGKPRDR